jgi:hypothetical protein
VQDRPRGHQGRGRLLAQTGATDYAS